jgi:bifunctional DNA-binding transcriptional regulator/antitoxin component of YhaV-PrlF toxin-antitoxin module
MKKYKFKAKIQAGDGGGAFIFFPFDVQKEFGTKGRIPIDVTFDGVPDKSSLIRYGYPQHLAGVPKAIREKIDKQPGDHVEVVVWKDETPRPVEIPEEFAKRLEKEKLLAFFEALSNTHRKEYVRWITEAKKEETRKARFEKAVVMLKQKVKTPQ